MACPNQVHFIEAETDWQIAAARGDVTLLHPRSRVRIPSEGHTATMRGAKKRPAMATDRIA